MNDTKRETSERNEPERNKSLAERAANAWYVMTASHRTCEVPVTVNVQKAIGKPRGPFDTLFEECPRTIGHRSKLVRLHDWDTRRRLRTILNFGLLGLVMTLLSLACICCVSTETALERLPSLAYLPILLAGFGTAVTYWDEINAPYDINSKIRFERNLTGIRIYHACLASVVLLGLLIGAIMSGFHNSFVGLITGIGGGCIVSSVITILLRLEDSAWVTLAVLNVTLIGSIASAATLGAVAILSGLTFHYALPALVLLTAVSLYGSVWLSRRGLASSATTSD